MFIPLWPGIEPDAMASSVSLQSCDRSDQQRQTSDTDAYEHPTKPKTSSLLDNLPPHGQFTFEGEVPVVEMARDVLNQIMFTIGNRPPETGGVLTGPIGEPLKVTGYYFDTGASCTCATYSPDTATINNMRNEEWLPADQDWNGFIHSHPGGFDRPSDGDTRYFKKLLKSSDESVLIAPIVIPEQFRLVPYVVYEGHEEHPRYAHLSII